MRPRISSPAEGGGAAALGGVQIMPLPGARGQFDVATLEAALLPRARYAVPQTLVAVEQTVQSRRRQRLAELAALRAVADWAHAHGMATHMDGARLMNAVVASGVPAAEMAAGYDSVWLDFTKGLGAPLGAVLCGSADFIDRAWVWKQRLGGALRQAGICAAACLYALDHHVARLAEDHANAAALARGAGADRGRRGGDAGDQPGVLRHARDRAAGRGAGGAAAGTGRDDVRDGGVAVAGLHASRCRSRTCRVCRVRRAPCGVRAALNATRLLPHHG